MPESFGGWPFLIPVVAIIGGFVLAGLSIYAQIRRREFEHRERLAMIERGVTPPPPPAKAEPDGMLPTQADVWGPRAEGRESRTRRGGFVLMAIGFGIGFMIWMTSQQPADAIGIGGFLMILGAAVFLSSFFGGGRTGGPTADASRR